MSVGPRIGESQPPLSQERPTDKARSSPEPPPIVPEDLTRIGVGSQLVSETSRIEQSPNGTPPLSPVETENIRETLEKVASSSMVNQNLKNRFLRKFSPVDGVLPKSYYLSGVTMSEKIPFASGGFADIWKGQRHGKQVCIKAFRTEPAANLDKVKWMFYREIVKWKRLSHPNVVPFLGISETLFSFCIITPWMSNGSITEFIRKHRGVDRFRLLAQAASGLEYLHSQGIVHSNLTPGNILIAEDGNACVGDFGITAVITEPSVVERNSTATSNPGVVRYMAPELLTPSRFGLDNSNRSKDSDIFSFAMITYEVLSGVPSYTSASPETVIALKIASGMRPLRPDNPTANRWLLDPIWDVLQRCWEQNPQSRSSISSLRRAFVESGRGQNGDTPVTENVEVTKGTRGTTPSHPEPSSSEKKSQAQSTPPSTVPPGPHTKPPVQQPPVRPDPLKKVLGVFRHRR